MADKKMAKKTTAKKKTSKKKATRKRKGPPPLPFSYQLVLNQWLFSLFGFNTVNGRYAMHGSEESVLKAFRDRYQIMGEAAGRNTEGEHEIVQRILSVTEALPGITEEDLRDYDRNIKHITEKLNEGRAIVGLDSFEWKYFQYLMLLFTEVYLDWYFQKPDKLLEVLNKQVEKWNDAHPEQAPLTKLNEEEIPELQLNKIAYWSATGSGKTLIMHANIMQYQYYLDKYGNRKDLDHIILLTPNEGLTTQHLKELHASGIDASNKLDSTHVGMHQTVIVIDIGKFRDEAKKKTVATESFGNKNLLLVDEGHRGASGGGGEWMRHRNALCEKGFSFEYSATFAQAAMNHDDLRQIYTKAILFDYSYRYFYEDGYGKQSQILNLQQNQSEKEDYYYLVASLLTFYQQRRYFDDEQTSLKPFNIERPLWVFVSGNVNTEDSHAVQILRFINRVVTDKKVTVASIKHLLQKGMVVAGGTDLLSGRFEYLKGLAESAEEIYADLLQRIFHCAGGSLYIENITGVKGEIALRVGASDIPFGVINIGDDSGFIKLCETGGLNVLDSRFGESLFNSINQQKSPVNVLVGSRKFTEGWSSWRVSNMTLINVGRNEGAQIIQLFGRGVRLKGWNETLKRSAEVVPLMPEDIERPKYISVLETLNIFGVKADYIAQFRQQLEDEEILVNEGLSEYRLPLKRMIDIPDYLNVIRLKDSIAGRAIGKQGSAFAQLAEQVMLLPVSKLKNQQEKDYFINPVRIVKDWYPKVKGYMTDGEGKREVGRDNVKLTELHIAMLDLNKLYFELQAFKRDKRWANLTISRDVILDILKDQSWYTLYIPKDEMKPGALDGLQLWHDIAVALLKSYCETFYGWRRKQWEADKLEYQSLQDNPELFPGVSEETPEGSYLITVDQVRHESLIKQLDKLRGEIIAGNVSEWRGQTTSGLEFLWCENHLYQPLLAQYDKQVDVSPVPLNEGERTFVEDMQRAMENGVFSDCEAYLLRNDSRGNGVGFFLEGGFYPDFILWLIKGEKQKIAFIDPKGLKMLPFEHPKIRFHETIKDTESKLNMIVASSQTIELHAFLISNTSSAVLQSEWSKEDAPVTKEDMENRNILFQVEDKDIYISKIKERLIS